LVVVRGHYSLVHRWTARDGHFNHGLIVTLHHEGICGEVKTLSNHHSFVFMAESDVALEFPGSVTYPKAAGLENVLEVAP